MSPNLNGIAGQEIGRRSGTLDFQRSGRRRGANANEAAIQYPQTLDIIGLNLNARTDRNNLFADTSRADHVGRGDNSSSKRLNSTVDSKSLAWHSCSDSHPLSACIYIERIGNTGGNTGGRSDFKKSFWGRVSDTNSSAGILVDIIPGRGPNCVCVNLFENLNRAAVATCRYP